MKYILLFIFLFISSVSASENALSCSYDVNGKTINFGYYITSEGTPVITDFVFDGENYDFYHNKISTGELSLECPVVNVVNFYGNSNPHYFITKNREDFDLSIDKIIYDDKGNLIGQIDGNIYKASNISSVEYVHYSSREIYASEGVTDEVRKQMNENIKSYGGNACKYIEKQAIANYFYANDFNSISTFAADNVFQNNGEYIKLSSNCVEVAHNLYNSVIALRHMLSDYVDDGGDMNTLNYLSLQSAFYAGYGSLTTLWYDNTISENPCDAINDDIRNILNSFFDIFRLVVVILTIFMIYLDGMKCLAKKDDSETKKWISNASKRIIVLVICLMLPLIINLVLDFLNKYMSGSMVKVNGECVKVVTGG